MKNKILFFVILLFLVSLTSISFKLVQSAHIQTVLLYDFNNGEEYFRSDKYKNKLDENFPTITFTSLPIKYLKARYLLGYDSTSTVKALLYKAIKDNPYIKAPEVMLAKYYLTLNELDSALYYSKNAFKGIPNNNAHRNTYFKVLARLKDSISIDKAFKKIRDYNNTAGWIDYIIYRNDINGKPDKRLIDLIEDFKIKFPGAEESKIKNIKNFLEVGSKTYSYSIFLSELANESFLNENYLEAIRLYEEAISVNDKEYVFYENAAISYDNVKNHERATEYFDKVIYDFKSEDGRAEFFKGLMLIKLEDDLRGCEYLLASAQKNYIGRVSSLKASDVYIALCINNINN